MVVPRRDALRALLASCAALAGCDAPPAPPPPAASPPPPPPASSPPSPALAPPPPEPPLHRAFPRLARQLPRVPLVTPTPVEPAARLGRRAGLGALYVKRDDLGGDLYGGGKPRKLELLLGEALERGAREVITFGGAGSNHAVATALYAARLGLRAILLLAPQAPGPGVRENLLAARRAGAELRWVPAVAEAEAEAQRLARRARATADRAAPYVIPAGGTSPLGNLAFVNAALELAEQIAAGALPAPERIYMAMGTMGSAAGLALGLTIAGLRAQVVAVRASSPELSSEGRLLTLAGETVAYARALDPAFPRLALGRGDVRVEGRFLGRGYARATPEGERAIAMAREEEGWALEPTYTGKALAALLADAPAIGDRPALLWCSQNARPLAIDGVDAESLPPALRAYVAPGR